MRIITKQTINPMSLQLEAEDEYRLEKFDTVVCVRADGTNPPNILIEGKRYKVLEDQEGPSRVKVLGENGQVCSVYRFRFKPVVRVKV